MSSASTLLAALSGSPSLKMVMGWPHRIGACTSVQIGIARFISLSKLKLSLVGRTWSRYNDVHVSPQLGTGLVHLVLCLVVRLLVVRLTGVGRQALHPQVQRRLLHAPWLLRLKRDCTPALFLTSSVCTPAMSL